MAKRYYTAEAKKQIKRIITEIDNSDVDPVVKAFSDVFNRLLQFLGIQTVEKYQDDMETWYNLVLDSHNTTYSRVEEIVEKAIGVDLDHRDLMKKVLESIDDFQSTLNSLRDVISGKTTLVDGKAAADGYLASGKNSLNSASHDVLNRVQQGALWDACKQLFGDALKFGAGYIKIRSGGDAADYKSFADTCLATVCDLLAIGSVFLASVGAVGDTLDGKMDISYDDYLDAQFILLSPAQELKEINSITDFLESLAVDMEEKLAECPENSEYYPLVKKTAERYRLTADASKTVDFVEDAYGLYSDGKELFDDLGNLTDGKVRFLDELQEEYGSKPIDDYEIVDRFEKNNKIIYKVKDAPDVIVKKTISDLFGLPTSGWSNPDKFEGNVYKTVSTIWSYGEKLLPDPATGSSNAGELPDVFLGKTRDASFVKDIVDWLRDGKELIYPEPIVAPSAEMGGESI